jgi:hypothetical protein
VVVEPAEDALGGDPAVLVELDVVLDLSDLEPGQVVRPEAAEELDGLPAP